MKSVWHRGDVDLNRIWPIRVISGEAARLLRTRANVVCRKAAQGGLSCRDAVQSPSPPHPQKKASSPSPSHRPTGETRVFSAGEGFFSSGRWAQPVRDSVSVRTVNVGRGGKAVGVRVFMIYEPDSSRGSSRVHKAACLQTYSLPLCVHLAVLLKLPLNNSAAFHFGWRPN